MGLLSAVKGLVVVGSNGSVDVDATVAAVKVALIQEIEHSAVRNAEIAKALDVVYDRLQTDVFATPSVVAMAAAILAGQNLTEIATISEEIKGFLETSPRFKGERGRKGGLKRLYK